MGILQIGIRQQGSFTDKIVLELIPHLAIQQVTRSKGRIAVTAAVQYIGPGSAVGRVHGGLVTDIAITEIKVDKRGVGADRRAGGRVQGRIVIHVYSKIFHGCFNSITGMPGMPHGIRLVLETGADIEYLLGAEVGTGKVGGSISLLVQELPLEIALPLHFGWFRRES